MNITFTKATFSQAYNTHGRWHTLKELIELEQERGNYPCTLFDLNSIEHYKNSPAMWVCIEPIQAFRYNCFSDERDLPANELIAKYPDWKDTLSCITSKNIWIVDHTDDGDNGFLVIDVR